MMRNALLLILLILAVGLTGCSDEGPAKPPPIAPSAYKPLDRRDNLLYNLEQAYNQRNFEEFSKLLERTPGVFIFYFGQADIDMGNAAVPRWDVAVELSATQGLMDRSPPPGQPVADDIVLELDYTEDEDNWESFVPTSFPQETWCRKIIGYRLTIRIGPTTHTQNKATYAEFTARFTEVQGDSIWQLVTWRDDVPAPPGSSRYTGERAPSDTGETTWGGIKELFRK
jgi:hypothetical protein